MTIIQAVMLCFLLAALIRAPREKGAHIGAAYVLLVGVLVYLLVTGVGR